MSDRCDDRMRRAAPSWTLGDRWGIVRYQFDTEGAWQRLCPRRTVDEPSWQGWVLRLVETTEVARWTVVRGSTGQSRWWEDRRARWSLTNVDTFRRPRSIICHGVFSKRLRIFSSSRWLSCCAVSWFARCSFSWVTSLVLHSTSASWSRQFSSC